LHILATDHRSNKILLAMPSPNYEESTAVEAL